MAQQVQVTFVDDIDGSVADGTVSFALDKSSFEIDLSEANAAKLRDIFAPYVGAARKAGGTARAPRRTASRPASSRSDTKALREWAEAQGMTISARGRISSEVRQAYENRHEAAPAEKAPAAEKAPTRKADAEKATAEKAEAPAKKRRSKAPAATFVSAG